MQIATTPPTDWFGSTLDFETLERLTFEHIDAKTLKIEPELYEKKWFDYRPMHPAAATYLMVHHYNRAFGDFLARCVNVKLRYVQGITGKDFMLVNEKRSFWRLRQLIDELGMPYDFFLRHAMLWHIDQGFGKGVPQPPRPAHIINRPDMIVEIANDWVNEQRARIQWASHPRYTVEEWAAAPDQVAYEASIVAQIKRRTVQQYSLHAALYQFDALRIEAAVQHFDEDLVTQAVGLDLVG